MKYKIATMGIWGVKNNLVRVINYVSNEDKTTEALKDLHNEIDYISNNNKTEEKLRFSEPIKQE